MGGIATCEFARGSCSVTLGGDAIVGARGYGGVGVESWGPSSPGEEGGSAAVVPLRTEFASHVTRQPFIVGDSVFMRFCGRMPQNNDRGEGVGSPPKLGTFPL